MSKKYDVKMTPKRTKFMLTYKDYDDSEILKEVLLANQSQLKKLEKIRSNTSKLVWGLIVLPIILGILALVLGIGSLAI